MDTDQHLVDRARQGDHLAFGQLNFAKRGVVDTCGRAGERAPMLWAIVMKM